MEDDPVRDEALEEAFEEGGDAACWAHLVCAECGRVIEPGGPHRCGDEEDHTPATN